MSKSLRGVYPIYQMILKPPKNNKILNLDEWKKKVRQLKTETYAIYLASKDPRVPWYAKAIIIFVVVHAFSPIDLIPDFIPVLGYLDDLVIVPFGIWLAMRMIPQEVLAECRYKAQEIMDQETPFRWQAALIILAIWILGVTLVILLVFRILAAR
jgi:uncharacterized membrane protein YkvA (DUF1232 family)